MSEKITSLLDIGLLSDSKGVVISLCDLTGVFVEPWVEAGFDAILVDPQHESSNIDYSGKGRVLRLSARIEDVFHLLGDVIRNGKVVFVAGFPPCTDVAVSGARWWESKREADPYFQAKASIVAEQCRTIGAISGAPWFFENPRSAFSKIFGKPQHEFHPWHYCKLAADDNYTKTTCLWAGNGFKMPDLQVNTKLGKPDVTRIWYASPGPDRENERSVTPRGFALAVFNANQPQT